MADAIRKGRRDGTVHLGSCQLSSSRTPGWRLVCGLAGRAGALPLAPALLGVAGDASTSARFGHAKRAPLNLGVRPSRNTPRAKATRAACSAAVAHSFLPPSWCAGTAAAQVEGALD